MSSHGWFDVDLLPLSTFDAEIDPFAWFDRNLVGFDDQVRISQSFLSWFDSGVVSLAWFDREMDPLAWFGDEGGPDDFPTLTALKLSVFAASPFAGSPFYNFGSAGSSSTRRLVYRSGNPAPTVGAAVNGRASAYYSSTAVDFDPADIAWTGAWEDPYAGSPWVAQASAGTSAANGNLTGVAPPLVGAGDSADFTALRTILVTAEQETKADGDWPASVFNSGKYGFTFTPSLASTDGVYAGFQSFFSNGDGGLWVVNREIALYNQTAAVISQAITWNASDNIRIVVDIPNATLTISGALTGNGSFGFTDSGTYFLTPDTLGVGRFNGGGFGLSGALSDVDTASSNLCLANAHEFDSFYTATAYSVSGVIAADSVGAHTVNGAYLDTPIFCNEAQGTVYGTLTSSGICIGHYDAVSFKEILGTCPADGLPHTFHAWLAGGFLHLIVDGVTSTPVAAGDVAFMAGFGVLTVGKNYDGSAYLDGRIWSLRVSDIDIGSTARTNLEAYYQARYF